MRGRNVSNVITQFSLNSRSSLWKKNLQRLQLRKKVNQSITITTIKIYQRTFNTASKPKKKRKAVSGPRRRSKRLKGEKADIPKQVDVLLTTTKVKKVHHASFSEEQLEKYKRLMEKHAQNGIKLPPNATYRHTVHRVLSMSEKALSRRVRVIENARGKYAVLKMRMFAEVLILEGYDDIASEASAALGRLMELPKYKSTAAFQAPLYEKVVSTTK